MREVTIDQVIDEALAGGGTRSFVQPSDRFRGDRSGELKPFLDSLITSGLNVETRGSKEALVIANLHPGIAVEGCSIYEGDAEVAGGMLKFVIARGVSETTGLKLFKA